jgi:hypothetical protein
MLQAHPKCPTLSYIIATRVTNPYEDADAFISFTGRKGSGKTTASSAFAEAVAVDIAAMRGKNESPKKFFTIDNVRSITEMGALELLSSGALTKENSVFLLDDTGTQWGSRNFQSPINKTLNSILQICRIYKCVIIANFILQSHIDIQARGMVDFRAEMQFKNTKEEYSVFKFYYLEQGTKNGKPHEYKKYLKWNGKRITQWTIGKPSKGYQEAYKKIRKENTDEFILNAKQRVAEILEKNGVTNEDKQEAYKKDARMRDYNIHPEILRIKDKVIAMRNDPDLTKRQKTDTAIARELDSTRYWVGRIK